MGHLLRENNGIERHIRETEMVAKRAGGRKRMIMFDWMTMSLNVHTIKDLRTIAKDRETWRKSTP